MKRRPYEAAAQEPAASPAGARGDILAAAIAATHPEAPPLSLEALAAMAAGLLEERELVLGKVAELEAFEAEHVLDESDEVLDANAAEIVRTRRRASRLEILVQRVGELRSAAETREAEAARQARYAAAVDAARGIEAWVREHYAAHAAAIGEGLAQLALIAATVDAANADRPPGAPRIDLEGFRALPAIPDETTEVTRSAYVDRDGIEVVPTDAAPLSQDGARYFVGPPHERREVFAQQVTDSVGRPGRPAVAPRPLPVAVHLPGVGYAEVDFWPRRSKLWGT